MNQAAYRAQLLGRLRAVTDDLAWASDGLVPAQHHYKPAANEWSIHEHLSHVRDMEQEVLLPLLRWATVAEMLEPLNYNRRIWHDLRYRHDEPVQEVMEDLYRMRDEQLTVLAGLSDARWLEYRTDSRWGALTCQWLAELMYRHALDHLQCIFALKQDLHLAAAQLPPVVSGGYIGGKLR